RSARFTAGVLTGAATALVALGGRLVVEVGAVVDPRALLARRASRAGPEPGLLAVGGICRVIEDAAFHREVSDDCPGRGAVVAVRAVCRRLEDVGVVRRGPDPRALVA